MIEKQVSKGIIRTYFEKMEKCLELDVAIVGGGPSGIAAAYYMAKAGASCRIVRPQVVTRRRYVGRSDDVQPTCHTGRGTLHPERFRH